MKKPVESYDGYNLPITKETIEALSESIHQLSQLYKNYLLQPGEGLILSGVDHLRSGLIYFDNEVLPWKSSDIADRFSVVDNPMIIEGDDHNGMPYKSVINSKYAIYDPAGDFLVSSLTRVNFVTNYPTFNFGFNGLYPPYFSDSFVLNSESSFINMSQQGRVEVAAVFQSSDVLSWDGFSPNTHVFTMANGFRPKLPTNLDALYFTVYVKRPSQSPVRIFPLPAFINAADGKVYLQLLLSGDSFSIIPSDLIYLHFEYYVR